MEVWHHEYLSQEELDTFIQQNRLNRQKRLLVQVFTGEKSTSFIQNLVLRLNAALPEATLMGTTTAGEMIDGRVRQGTTVLSFIAFEKTALSSAIVTRNGSSYETGQHIARQLIQRDTRLIIAYADFLTTNGDKFLKGIFSVAPEVPVAGGLASDNNRVKKSHVFSGDTLIPNGVVAVAFHNPELRVQTHCSLDWTPLGPGMTITRAEGNRVIDIDNTPALELFRHYLGREGIGHFIGHSNLFPLLTVRNGRSLPRVCLRILKDGSLQMAGNLHTGETVRFGIGDTTAVTNSIRRTFDTLSASSPEVIFIYSCLARRLIAGEFPEIEISQLPAIAPMCGFFTYGAFFHFPEGNEFFNHTFTALALSERAQRKKHHRFHPVKPPDDPDLLRMTVLSHLVNVTTRKYEEATEKQEGIAHTDALTGLLNRRRMQDLLEQERYRSARYDHPLSVILYDIDHFKSINDTYGHQVGDDILKKISEVTRKNLRASDYLARWGGEEFLILCPETTGNNAHNLAERVREATLSEITINGTPITVSLGVCTLRENEEVDNLIRRTDHAMYESKHRGRNQVTMG